MEKQFKTDMHSDALIQAISPPLDETLFRQLVSEYESIYRRFVLRDWEPATLDGGQFCEAAARLLYHQDSGNLNQRKSSGKCLDYIEDMHQRNPHVYPDRKSALHTCKALRTIYKFRSDRGAIHIDPVYSANELDARLVLECARWVFAELLRVFWNGDRADVARILREILQFDVPAIAEYDGQLLVQRVDCNAEEEILILLHHAGANGLNRTHIGKYVQHSPPRVSEALRKLSSNRCREIVKIQNNAYRLTDIGIQRVQMDLADKLVVG